MGLILLAVIGAVGVALLPSDREQQAVLYTRAASAATWTMTFCDRNAATCTQAGTVWAEFRKKAEFGAEVAYDMIKDGNKGPAPVETASITVVPPDNKRPERQTPRNTLTNADLKPEWRGKAPARAP